MCDTETKIGWRYREDHKKTNHYDGYCWNPKCPYDNYHQQAKGKKQTLCGECKFEKYKLYRKTLEDESHVGGCCGVTIYKIIPLDPNQNLRCHHVYYGHELETDPGDICVKHEPVAIKDWIEVWKVFKYWTTYDLSEKYRKWYGSDINFKNYQGKLKKGIFGYDGNGGLAVVVDQKNNMYLITGYSS